MISRKSGRGLKCDMEEKYTRQQVRVLINGISLLYCAEDIHGFCTGALDCGIEEIKKFVRILNMVLETWQEPSSPFDLGVKHLIQLALCEYNNSHWNT